MKCLVDRPSIMKSISNFSIDQPILCIDVEDGVPGPGLLVHYEKCLLQNTRFDSG